MDEYGRTGNKSSRAAALQREREQQIKLEKVLRADDEEQVKAIVQEVFAIGEGDPRYPAILQIWRQHHPAR